jgi:hypothetical protein
VRPVGRDPDHHENQDDGDEYAARHGHSRHATRPCRGRSIAHRPIVTHLGLPAARAADAEPVVVSPRTGLLTFVAHEVLPDEVKAGLASGNVSRELWTSGGSKLQIPA